MAKKPNKQEVATTQSKEIVSDGLVDELRDLIQETRSGVAQAVNSALVQLYWRIGTRVRTEILKNCLLYTSPSPRDRQKSRMPSSA